MDKKTDKKTEALEVWIQRKIYRNPWEEMKTNKELSSQLKLKKHYNKTVKIFQLYQKAWYNKEDSNEIKWMNKHKETDWIQLGQIHCENKGQGNLEDKNLLKGYSAQE